MKTYKRIALIAKEVIGQTKICCDRRRKRRKGKWKREDDEDELF